jgi:hypothetical protein
MYTIAAAYGYIAPEDTATAWGADMIIAEADTLTHWLRHLSPTS